MTFKTFLKDALNKLIDTLKADFPGIEIQKLLSEFLLREPIYSLLCQHIRTALMANSVTEEIARINDHKQALLKYLCLSAKILIKIQICFPSVFKFSLNPRASLERNLRNTAVQFQKDSLAKG